MRRVTGIVLTVTILVTAICTGCAPLPEQSAVRSNLSADTYDLVVIGAEPEGIAAAVSAAREGLHTLLLDPRPTVGGLITRGWLNSLDMNKGPGGEILNRGIFQEFYSQLEGQSFDIQTAARAFDRLLRREKGLDVQTDVANIVPVLHRDPSGWQIAGVRFRMNGRTWLVRAPRWIDATADADFAAAAGASFTYGGEDYGLPGTRMAVTQIFQVKGVTAGSWARLAWHLLTDGDPRSGATLVSAWGFSREMKAYRPRTPGIGVRGLNIGRQRDGSLLINALQIFGVDGLRPGDRARARRLARAELPHLVRYLREHLPGFEQAELGALAPELYIRETRHLRALYRLRIEDVLENRDFWDRVAFGSYPVDIQATGPDDPGTIIGQPIQYAVPFRSLIPQGVGRLLVVGRCAGFDSLAAGSARTVPVGMATGQAAGVAAAVSLSAGVDFAEMSRAHALVAALQRKLQGQGVVLRPYHTVPRVMLHWAYPGLRFMRHYGLAAGGYDNRYNLNQPISEAAFENHLRGALIRCQGKKESSLPPPAVKRSGSPGPKPLTLQRAAALLARYDGFSGSPEQALDHYILAGIVTPEVLGDAKKQGGALSRGAGYVLIAQEIHRSWGVRGDRSPVGPAMSTGRNVSTRSSHPRGGPDHP